MFFEWLDWPVPSQVKAGYTLRLGGVSASPYDSFNLGDHVDDVTSHVVANRVRLQQYIHQPSITWLEQVHGVDVLDLSEHDTHINHDLPYQADASVSRISNTVCCVMTADCLPVFFADSNGQQVAVAHAGWRGLLDGVLQNTLQYFQTPQSVLVYLGPAISQQAFEVGEEVKAAFVQKNPRLSQYFIPSLLTPNAHRWMADLYGIARHLMTDAGVQSIYGGNRCTYTESEQFFSYRRDGVTGRMANIIWLEK